MKLISYLLAAALALLPVCASANIKEMGGVSTPVAGANGGTGMPLATFPVRDYKFAADADDTLSIQRALTAAQAAPCGTVILDAKTYQISSAINWTGCAAIQGAGDWLYTTTGSVATYPYVKGTVIVQNTAATDILQPSGEMQWAPIKGVGMTFAESIIFSNTGHCVNATPPVCSTCSGQNGYLQGVWHSTWSDDICFGNDGNHYGFYEWNAIYNKYENLMVTGGGGFSFGNYTTSDNPDVHQTGNSELHNLTSLMLLSGSGHGYVWNNNQSQSTGSYSNYWSGDRVQCVRMSVASINGHSLTPPGSTQYNFYDNTSPFISLDGVDLEGCTNGGTSNTCLNGFAPTLGSLHLGFAGPTGQALSRGNYGINFHDSAAQSLWPERGRYDDFSMRASSLESAGSTYVIAQDSANQSLAYALDGTRVTSVPGGLLHMAGPKGLCVSTFTPATGYTFFDTTDHALVTYQGGTWYAGNGTATCVPAAGATSANDSFARTASTLGTSDGGQVWQTYISAGTAAWSTNGSAAVPGTTSNNFADNLAFLFTNNSDGTVQVTESTVGTSPLLIFRLSDRNNYWRVTTTALQKCVNNSCGNPSGGAVGWSAFTSGSVISVVLSGTSITVKNNGTTVGSTTGDSFNQTATGYGIGAHGDTTSRFTSFSVVNP